MFLKKYGRTVLKYIYYDENSDAEQIVENVKALKKTKSDLIFCMPELFRHKEQIFIMLFKAGLSPFINWFIYRPERISLFNYTGAYEDIFNNYIVTEGVNNFNIYGLAAEVIIQQNKFKGYFAIYNDSRIYIENGFAADEKSIVKAGQGSKIKIAKNTQFVACADISCHFGCSIIIGEDCLFSLHQMVFAGNGHSIFSHDNGKWEKVPDEQTISIGNHVWVGYRCNIIGGADIGDGCIIGAGSTVNKRIPNNCIAAGIPAKIVKRNRAWTRNLFLHELEQDINVYNNFANLTKED
jgi:acetyltransferase-like isoleucine patch superfamily enzyme